MRTTFRFHKATQAKSNEFRLAFNCAIESINSILYDFKLVVDVDFPDVRIENPHGTGDTITSDHLARLTKGAFIDEQGNVYPEFHHIEIRT